MGRRGTWAFLFCISLASLASDNSLQDSFGCAAHLLEQAAARKISDAELQSAYHVQSDGSGYFEFDLRSIISPSLGQKLHHDLFGAFDAFGLSPHWVRINVLNGGRFNPSPDDPGLREIYLQVEAFLRAHLNWILPRLGRAYGSGPNAFDAGNLVGVSLRASRDLPPGKPKFHYDGVSHEISTPLWGEGTVMEIDDHRVQGAPQHSLVVPNYLHSAPWGGGDRLVLIAFFATTKAVEKSGSPVHDTPVEYR